MAKSLLSDTSSKSRDSLIFRDMQIRKSNIDCTHIDYLETKFVELQEDNDTRRHSLNRRVHFFDALFSTKNVR